jgi:protease-4
LKKRTFWILAAGVVAVALGAAAVGLVALVVGSNGPGWGGDQTLSMRVGAIPDQPPPDFDPFGSMDQLNLQAVVAALDKAAADSSVKGALLRVGFLGGAGWGRVQELRDALIRFRDSGKPVDAHLVYAGNREYYLASAGTRIVALPSAILDVSGLAAEVSFYEKTLEKVGVEAQFEGEGRYKNAPNQYTESGFTAPHREQIEALLDSLFAQYVEGIASGRGRSATEVRDWIDAGPWDAQAALEAGLVDELLYEDELEERAGSRVGLGRFAAGSGGIGFGGPSRVALVYAVGEILPGESQSGFFGSVAGSDTIVGALEEAAGDGRYAGILMRVDSPGGFGPAADQIWRAVGQARKKKPVVVSMGDAAASGGYYVAMGADAIVAQPGTITGSIGVFSGKFSLRGFYDRIGLTKEIIERGEHAAIYSDYRPWTAEERRRIRAMNAAFYQDFVTKAAEGRGMSFDELDAVAQGRVWTGSEAHELGLVDHLGGYATALRVLREKAGLAADAELRLEVLPEPKGLLETLFGGTEPAVLARSLPAEVLAALRWRRVVSAGGPIARLPFDLAIR